MEYNPTAVRGEIVLYFALKLLPFEYWTGVLGKVKEVFGYFGASGVGSRVDSDLDAVDELEEGLEQCSVHILAPYFLTHD